MIGMNRSAFLILSTARPMGLLHKMSFWEDGNAKKNESLVDIHPENT
jgi:hypothetical protein